MAQNVTPEEIHFLNLCFDLLDNRLQIWNIARENLPNHIEELKNVFRYHLGQRFTNFNLDDRANACAYLNRFVPIHTALIRDAIVNAISNCEVLNEKIQQSKLNVLNIGCGPGVDVVGFCSALHEFGISGRERLEFTFLDSVGLWGDFIDDMWRMVRGRNYGNASVLLNQFGSENVTFIAEGLSNINSQNVVTALQSADIILAPKLFSIVRQPQSILRGIDKSMKKGALLILIDSDNAYGDQNWYKEEVTKCRFNLHYESVPKDFELNVPGYEHMHRQGYSTGVCKKARSQTFVFQKVV